MAIISYIVSALNIYDVGSRNVMEDGGVSLHNKIHNICITTPGGHLHC